MPWFKVTKQLCNIAITGPKKVGAKPNLRKRGESCGEAFRVRRNIHSEYAQTIHIDPMPTLGMWEEDAHSERARLGVAVAMSSTLSSAPRFLRDSS